MTIYRQSERKESTYETDFDGEEKESDGEATNEDEAGFGAYKRDGAALNASGTD